MTSEINSLLKGSLVSTVEFDTNKKIIGVSTANLTPNESGIAPLGKQGAFKVEKEEAIETFDIAVNDALAAPVEETIENVDLPKMDEPAQGGKFIPEPQESDIVLENPVDVSGIDTLSSLTAPVSEEQSTTTEIVEPVVEPELDIQLPEMPEQVVAEAPSGLNDNLFVDTPSEAVETIPVTDTTPVENPEMLAQSAPAVETASAILPSLTDMEVAEKQTSTVETAPVINLDSILDQKKKELIDRINALTEAEISKYSDELKELFSKNNAKINAKINEVDASKNSKPDMSDASLMNDALSRIDNIAGIDSNNGISM